MNKKEKDLVKSYPTVSAFFVTLLTLVFLNLVGDFGAISMDIKTLLTDGVTSAVEYQFQFGNFLIFSLVTVVISFLAFIICKKIAGEPVEIRGVKIID